MPSSTMRVPMAATHAQRLPEYNGPGQAPVVAQTSARLDDSAGAIATANWRNGTAGPWKDMAATFNNVAKTTDNVHTMYERYSKYRAQEALNNYQEEMMIKKADLERLQGSGAIGANGGQSVQQQLREYAQEARERLGKDLNERSRMFFDNFATSEDRKNYVWAVQKEQKEWQSYQKTVDAGTIATANNAAQNDSSQLGYSMGIVQATVEQMGRREGWSPEYTRSMIQQEEQKLLTGVISNAAANRDVPKVVSLMGTYASKLSPENRLKMQDAIEQLRLNEAMNAYAEGRYEDGDRIMSGATDYKTNGNVYQGMNGQVGSLSAKYESASEGISAVGYDSTGGTSYGKYQIASKPGGMDEYLDMLAAHSPEGAAIAERLRHAGTMNTGSREGTFPDQWRRESATHGKIMEEVQHQWVSKTKYEPTLKALPPELRKRISENGVLQDVVWSTAVQHANNSAGIINKVYKPGMSDADLIRAIYAERKTRFPSSTEEVRRNVAKRMDSECADALGAIGAGPTKRVNTSTVAWGEEREPGYLATPDKPIEMDELGNVDINNRPMVKNDDGSVSTVRSISIGEDDKVVLLPTIGPNGEKWTDEQAIENYKKTGQHLGKFRTQNAADVYAEDLHNQQAKMYPAESAVFADGNGAVAQKIDPTTGLPISAPRSKQRAMPNFSFSNPSMNYRAQQAWKAAQKDRSEATVRNIVDQVIPAVTGLQENEMAKVAIDKIASLTQDPEERTMALKLVNAQMEFDITARKSAILTQASQAVEEGRKANMAPTDFLNSLAKKTDMTPEARTLAAQMYRGEIKENIANMQATDELFRAIDADPQNWNADKVYAYGYNKGMTLDQIKKGKEYLANGGKLKGLSTGRIEGLWKDVTGKRGKNDHMPAGFYDRILSKIPEGSPASDEVLRKLVRQEAWDGYINGSGTFWNDSETYAEAQRNGRADKWMPEVTGENRQFAIDEICKMFGWTRAQFEGLAPEMKNSMVVDFVKQQQMGIPVNKG